MMPVLHRLLHISSKYQLNGKASRLFSSKSDTSSSSSSTSPNVPGLSSKVLDVPKGAVGPGASKSAEYKNPEYFSYHQTSYFDAELEMLKYRLPQPSNKSK